MKFPSFSFLIIFSILIVLGVVLYVGFWPSNSLVFFGGSLEGMGSKEKSDQKINPRIYAENLPSDGDVSQDFSYPYVIENAMGSIKPGVNYVPLSEQNLPLELKAKMARDLNNLRNTGSLSGGVTPLGFLRLDEMSGNLEREGKNKLEGALAIIPTNSSTFLSSDAFLLGADVQAKYIPDRGWSGYFQIFKNGQQFVEISESQFESHVGDGAQQTTDFLNEKIMGYPAVFQYRKINDGSYEFDIQWFVGNRVFDLTTRNFTRQDIFEMARSVTANYLQMPNEGWKSPYVINSGESLLKN